MIDAMNELKDGQVFTLHPSEETTSKIGELGGCTAEQIEQMAPVAKGNPGAMNYLLALRKEFSPIDFKVLLLCLNAKGITGPSFYLFVKTLGVEEAARQFKETWLR